jgi:hypothetical protein
MKIPAFVTMRNISLAMIIPFLIVAGCGGCTLLGFVVWAMFGIPNHH